jgi:RNA polymerase sigma-70 factor (ECF subfamily)
VKIHQDIIDGIKSGNKESFKIFFNDFYPVLCLFAEKFLNDPQQSKDVAQEAFIRFWEKKENFNDLKSARNFLYVVVKNESINVLKKSKRTENLTVLEEAASESFLKQNIIQRETFFLVRQAVKSLPDRMREVIEHSMLGMKNDEIAMQLGISPLTVHTSKKNAYRKLREMLKYVKIFV